jgi:hypothetical protein
MVEPPMTNSDPFENQSIRHIQSFIYLIPVLGFFPALWTLAQRNGNREQRDASRIAIKLALGWLFGYLLLATAAQTADAPALPLLITSSLLTSGYFLVNIWLMVRLWQRKPLKLPGLAGSGDRTPPFKKTRLH